MMLNSVKYRSYTMEKFQSGVKINIDNLISNYRNIKKSALDRQVIPVIKADAYGHGAEVAAKFLQKEGVSLFAVSSVYEAMRLRENGVDADILILGYIPDRKIDKVIANSITPAIYNMDFARVLDKKAKEHSVVQKVHVKINTGMNRLGFQSGDFDDVFRELAKLQNLEVEGVFSHFATSDEADKTYSRRQYAIFEDALKAAEENGIDVKIRHIANSAAITDLPEYALDAVRAGLVLYGIYPSEVEPEVNVYKPVMSFHSTITNIFHIEKGETVGYGRNFTADKRTKVAVMCIGYADGYNRKLSNRARVIIGGKYEARVIGNVCMDMTMLAVREDDDIHVGDSVELFGENIPITELSDICGTIPYELLCCINKRVKREYIVGGKQKEFEIIQ